MINLTSSDIAIATAAEFQESNIALVPGNYPNGAETEVKLLTIISKAMDSGSLDESGYNPDPQSLREATTGINSIHTRKLNQIADSIAVLLSGQIAFAKNTAAPLAANIMLDLKDLLRSYPMDVKYSPVVIENSLPKLLMVDAVYTSIMGFSQIGFNEIKSFAVAKSKTADELREYLKCGNVALDGPLAEYLVTLPDTVITKVWDVMFVKDPNGVTFESLYQNPAGSLAALILTLFYTHKLTTDLPETSPVSLDKYKYTLAEIGKQCSYRLACVIEGRQNEVKLQRLIKSFTKEQVIVNKEVYQAWLQEGGNNAVLFGAMLTERPEEFVEGLNRRAKEYISVWTNNNDLLSQLAKNERESKVRTGLFTIVNKYVYENAHIWYQYLAPNGAVTFDHPEVQRIFKAVEVYIKKLTINDMENPRKVATKIVGEYLLSNHSAKEFLDGIDEAILVNPNMSPKEAAHLATIEYISDWVSRQFDVVALPPVNK